MDTTEQATQPSAYMRALRIAGIAIPVAVGLFAFLYVFGIAGFRGGWLWAPLITTPPAALLGWFGWGPARGRRAATAIVVLLGVAYGVWFSENAILSHGRLRAEMNSIAVPAGFEKLGDEPGGVSVCLENCTDFTRRWRAPGSTQEVMSTMTALLRSEGFELRPPTRGGADASTSMYGRRGRLGIQLYVGQRAAADGRAPQAGGEAIVTVTLNTFSFYKD